MKRNFDEFKAELFKRCDEYELKRKKRHKAILTTSTTLLLCVISVTAVLMWSVRTDFANFASIMGSQSENDAALPDPADEYDGEQYGENPQTDAGDADEVMLTELKVAYVDIMSQPENPQSKRHYTDPDKINAILDYFENLYMEDTELNINISGGVSYKVTVVYDDGSTKTYEQFDRYVKEADKGFAELDSAQVSQLEYLINTLPSD